MLLSDKYRTFSVRIVCSSRSVITETNTSHGPCVQHVILRAALATPLSAARPSASELFSHHCFSQSSTFGVCDNDNADCKATEVEAAETEFV